MASIIKILHLSKQLPIKPINPFIINSIRTAGSYSDWYPGPYPKTEEERIKAAEKYKLHPDEYVPYPDDDPMGFCLGDYPVLPLKHALEEDPFYPYDMPERYKNYGEPLNDNIDMLTLGWCPQTPNAYSLHYSSPVSHAYAAKCFFGMLFSAVFLLYIGEKYKVFRPVLEKQYPKPGVKYYTFESAK